MSERQSEDSIYIIAFFILEIGILSLELCNDRQLLCIRMLKVARQTTTMAYQNLVGCSRRTAAHDLDELLNKGIIQRKGAGRSAYYVLTRNRAIGFRGKLLASQDPNRALNVPSQEPLGSKLAEGKSKKDNKTATTGKGAHYVLRKKRPIKDSMES